MRLQNNSLSAGFTLSLCCVVLFIAAVGSTTAYMKTTANITWSLKFDTTFVLHWNPELYMSAPGIVQEMKFSDLMGIYYRSNTTRFSLGTGTLLDDWLYCDDVDQLLRPESPVNGVQLVIRRCRGVITARDESNLISRWQVGKPTDHVEGLQYDEITQQVVAKVNGYWKAYGAIDGTESTWKIQPQWACPGVVGRGLLVTLKETSMDRLLAYDLRSGNRTWVSDTFPSAVWRQQVRVYHKYITLHSEGSSFDTFLFDIHTGRLLRRFPNTGTGVNASCPSRLEPGAIVHGKYFFRFEKKEFNRMSVCGFDVVTGDLLWKFNATGITTVQPHQALIQGGEFWEQFYLQGKNQSIMFFEASTGEKVAQCDPPVSPSARRLFGDAAYLLLDNLSSIDVLTLAKPDVKQLWISRATCAS